MATTKLSGPVTRLNYIYSHLGAYSNSLVTEPGDDQTLQRTCNSRCYYRTQLDWWWWWWSEHQGCSSKRIYGLRFEFMDEGWPHAAAYYAPGMHHVGA